MFKLEIKQAGILNIQLYFQYKALFHFFSELLSHIFITLISKELTVLYCPLWKKERFTIAEMALLLSIEMKLCKQNSISIESNFKGNSSTKH